MSSEPRPHGARETPVAAPDSIGAVDAADWAACIRVLRVLAIDPSLAPDELVFKGLIKKVYQRGKRLRTSATPGAESKQSAIAADKKLVSRTALVASVRGSPPIPSLSAGAEDSSIGLRRRAVPCYVCKRPFHEVHHHYHLLCPSCAAFNVAKREARVDLTGKMAIVTGGRIKIGFATALRLLRDGANVLVTTRFPAEAARRYRDQRDFHEWAGRLRVCGLDFRNIRALETFLRELVRTEPWLDILVNNAAQTLHASPEHEGRQWEREVFARRHLDGSAQPALRHDSLEGDGEPVGAEDDNVISEVKRALSGLDDFGEPVDVAASNSWVTRLDAVGTAELVESQVVNAMAPFLFCSRLKPLFLRSPSSRRAIVNVTSKEGRFSAEGKREFHPHTNMAKAALNMLTLTSAPDFVRDGIFMNAVDPGWVSMETPWDMQERMRDGGFVPPLDLEDAAARIYDRAVGPLVDAQSADFGKLYKDYCPVAW